MNHVRATPARPDFMLVCGIKITHDGGVALLENGRLIFSIEIEKLDNNDRYAGVDSFETISDILSREGVAVSDIDFFSIDGWQDARHRNDDNLRQAQPSIATRLKGREQWIPVAPYIWSLKEPSPLRFASLPAIPGTVLERGYASYSHVAGHVAGTYCSSPFAKTKESALVLAWDGGMFPQLYLVADGLSKVVALGPLFPIMGNVFSGYCQELCAYKLPEEKRDSRTLFRHEMEVPGKAMALAACGEVARECFPLFGRLLDQIPVSRETGALVSQAVQRELGRSLPKLSDADLIASFQAYLGNLLVEELTRQTRRLGDRAPRNLCLTGGCGLNIKWNSAIRSSGLFQGLWVPPFTNDSGGALGAACCELFQRTGRTFIDWQVYSGPSLALERPPSSWPARNCDEQELAAILHNTGAPVTVLFGRAELGPRALGNRSILAAATNAQMKAHLNDIKDRESYRPVAPICLGSESQKVFEPGGHDPYMLFEHRVSPDWANRIPAIQHLDGTARLQTVDEHDRHTAAGRILAAYHARSGIPVLCNTSANHRAKGFFPDAASAATWGRTPYIWADGVLFSNPKPAEKSRPGSATLENAM